MGIASALHPPSLNTQHSFSENMTSGIDKEKAIRCIVESAVKSYASGFSTRHLAELDNTEGVINMKKHNVFIAALGPEIQYKKNAHVITEALDEIKAAYLPGI